MTSPNSKTRLERRWLAALVLVALVVAAYWPGRNGGFAFDDFPNIVENTAVHVSGSSWHAWSAAAFSSTASSLQRPLAMLSFAINYFFTGLDPMPMKLTNILLHALNALLVLAIVRRLATSQLPDRQQLVTWFAVFCAGAWALQPINVTAVLLVVQRMEVLCHTFVLLGLWAYISGRLALGEGRNGWPRIAVGLGFGTCVGLLAKESAVLLPVYALLVEWCVLRFEAPLPRQRRLLQGLFVAGLLFPLMAGLIWLLAGLDFSHVYATRGYSLGERLLTESRVLLDYLQWTLLPRLSQYGLYHDDYVVSHGLWDPPATLLALAALAVMVFAALRLRRRRPLFSLGLLWFLAAHALTATVIPLELVFEHRNYFASLGLCLSLGDALLLWPAQGSARRIGAFVALIAVCSYGVATFARAVEWSDPYSFARTEAARHPMSPRATYGLGQTLSVMSGYQLDSPWMRPAMQALERARHVPGATILPVQALLMLSGATGQPQQDGWWKEAERRLRERPPGAQEINALAALTRCARDGRCRFAPERMASVYDAALSHGMHPDILTLRGDYALNVLGDADQALNLWRQARDSNPGQPQYRVNLIKLLVAQNQVIEAKREIDALRGMGRFGQNEAAALEMEQRLRDQLDAGRANAH